RTANGVVTGLKRTRLPSREPHLKPPLQEVDFYLFLNSLTFLFIDYFFIVFVKIAVCFMIIAMVQLLQLKFYLMRILGKSHSV
ncbi:hypothetical protein, partial [Serratia quinivorans]|uniref:hypothetical protein n=1 Tax=Serratia quinivorans TaxID=137545 RepID=UPI0021BB24D1